MVVSEAGITKIPVNPEQPENADASIVTSVLGNVREPENPLLANAALPIVISVLESVRFVNPRQLLNAAAPMLVTELGIIRSPDNPEQL
jgi:hypothetical protein